MDELGITEIELDRGPCLGTCPVFRVTLTAAGRYQYEGRSHVEPVGTRTGRFPGYLFARLAEVCRDLNVLALNDLYPSNLDDAAFVRVVVRHTSGAKIIHDEGGSGAPARLWAFAILIEHAMREAFEIESRRNRS